MTVEFGALSFASEAEAIRFAKTTAGGKAIRLDGDVLVVSRDDADRLAAAGISFAYICQHRMADGTRRIMTVPIN